RVQGLGLPDLAVRAGKRADRARGGGGGGGGAVTGPRSARRAEGLRAAGRGAVAVWRARAVDHGLLPGAGGAVQADQAGGVRRPAQDDLRQDPPGGTARPGDVAAVVRARGYGVLGGRLHLVSQCGRTRWAACPRTTAHAGT